MHETDAVVREQSLHNLSMITLGADTASHELDSAHPQCALAHTLLQLVWFMTTSLQSRNYFVGHSGDTYLRMMLFWSIFMPMGEHFSLDRLRNNASAKDKAAYSTQMHSRLSLT